LCPSGHRQQPTQHLLPNYHLIVLIYGLIEKEMLELPNRDEEVLDSVDDAVGLGLVMAAWPTRIEAAAPSTAAAAASSTSLPQARNLLLPAAMEEGAASHARHWSRAKAKVNRRTEGSTFFVGRDVFAWWRVRVHIAYSLSSHSFLHRVLASSVREVYIVLH
jgi:hypothetical protein